MTADYIVADGRTLRAAPRAERPFYLYQTVHVEGGHPFYLEGHADCLDRSSAALFGRRFKVDAGRLETEIRQLIDANYLRLEATHFVRIELFSDGRRELRIAGTSLYDGYAMRCMRPAAVTVSYDLPMGEHPTALREAAACWATLQAELRGAQCAVRCDGRGVVLTADDAPLAAIRNYCCFVSPAPESVERNLLIECIIAAGLELREEPVRREELAGFDELVCFDHRGLTALASCDGRLCMDLMARRLERALQPF